MEPGIVYSWKLFGGLVSGSGSVRIVPVHHDAAGSDWSMVTSPPFARRVAICDAMSTGSTRSIRNSPLAGSA